jgi:hypothetical protein
MGCKVCLWITCVSCICFGCQYLTNRGARQQSMLDQSRPAVRDAALHSTFEFTAAERDFITANEPAICGCYFMAASYGQFLYRWDLPDGHRLNVGFVGDLKNVQSQDLRITRNAPTG